MNTDYAQYSALREREAYFKEMVNISLTDGETKAQENLIALQKGDVSDETK